jgi:dipeptidyl aminopeptidase/acylaminoacyl peptidase
MSESKNGVTGGVGGMRGGVRGGRRRKASKVWYGGALALVVAAFGVPFALHALDLHVANAGVADSTDSTGATNSLESLDSPDIERFFRIRAPGAVTVTRDGTMYVRDWPDGVFQLYRVEPEAGQAPVASPSARMTRLTSFRDGVSSYSVSPDGSRILIEAAAGGNENDQIYQLLPAEIGAGTAGGDASAAVKPLLTGAKVVHSLNLWLRHADGFVYTANDVSAEDFYIYSYVFGGDGGAGGGAGQTAGTSTRVLAEKGNWFASDVTADGSRMIVGQFRSASDSSMFELDVAKGTKRDLTPARRNPGAGEATTVSVSAVGYMPGEGAILFESDMEEGRARLFMMDLATGAVTTPLPSLSAYELDGAGMDREKTLLTVTTNEDGYAVTRLFRLPGFEPVAMPDLPRGLVNGGVRDGTLFVTVTNTRTPGLAYSWRVPTAGESGGEGAGELRQLTKADEQGIDLSAFPLPSLVTYRSFDGVEVPAFVYLPPGAEAGKPVPFVMNYHGGPEGQFRPGFDRTTQYLLSRGFGVMQPNVRGSTGYGRAFQMMDDYTKRWDSVRDGVAAAKYLVDAGLAEPGRIATWGGSYGGYMAVACLVEDAEAAEREGRARYFGAGIKQVGIVNLVTFLEQTSGYRRKLREAEYGPLSDPEFLRSVSPLLRSERIMVPMLLQHGLNDPRVPVGEAMQLATALQKRAVAGEPQVEPELLFFADEGHGIAKLDNRLLFARRMSAFLARTIGTAPEEAGAK